MARGEFFYGYAIISLDKLSFEHPLARNHRPVSKNNVERILKLFREVGCGNDVAEYAVTASVDAARLEYYLEEQGYGSLPQTIEDSTDVPRLDMPVECLHGLHRILAAKRFLKGGERWWMARIYRAG